MNLGLMPVTGLPLPFLSYGGSSMFAAWLALGLVNNVHLAAAGDFPACSQRSFAAGGARLRGVGRRRRGRRRGKGARWTCSVVRW